MIGASVSSADPLAVVRAYEEAANRGDVAACLALFADDGVIESAGGTEYRGQAELRAAHEHDVASATRIELRDCRVDGDIVMCELLNESAVERLLAIGPFQHQAEFSVWAGRITRFKALPGDPAARERMLPVLRSFQQWCREQHPELVARLWLADGRYAFNREAGEISVRLARAFRNRGQGTEDSE